MRKLHEVSYSITIPGVLLSKGTVIKSKEFGIFLPLERFSGQFTVFWASSWHESVFVGFTGAGRNGLWSARPLRGPRCGSVPRLSFLGGEAVAPSPHERFAGGLALARRARPVPGRVRPRRVGRLPAPAARCDLGGVARVAGRAGRTCREPSHAGAGGVDTGRAAKKKGVHAAGRDPGRVRALRAACVEALQAEGCTYFEFVDETRPNPPHGAAVPAPKAGNGPARPRPCTAGPTGRWWPP